MTPTARAVAGRVLLAGLALLCACGGDGGTAVVPPPPPPPSPPPAPPSLPTPPLRDLALARGIRIGSAAGGGLRLAGTDGTTFRAILGTEFNAFTPENDMKFGPLRPSQGTFYFASADSQVTFAQANTMQIRGHVLVWHQQLANWLTSGSWTQAQAESLMVQHIRTVVAHFKGQVVAWDVVNEALNDDGTRRTTFWSTTVGPDYIAKAFRAAALIDSTALLFYNDYNLEYNGAKADSAVALIQALQAAGVPIHGVGFQAHFQVGTVPSLSSLVAVFNRFAALGLTIHITELDVRMQLPTTPASLQTQADNYQAIVAACRQVAACRLITTWGFTDRDSWVPGTFPGWGAALPLDASFAAKPAWGAMRAAFTAP